MPKPSWKKCKLTAFHHSLYSNFLDYISISRFGTHAIVCCPGYSSTAIFFPSDPSHPEYGAGADDYYDDYGPSFDVDIPEVPEIPKVFLKNKSIGHKLLTTGWG